MHPTLWILSYIFCGYLFFGVMRRTLAKNDSFGSNIYYACMWPVGIFVVSLYLIENALSYLIQKIKDCNIKIPPHYNLGWLITDLIIRKSEEYSEKRQRIRVALQVEEEKYQLRIKEIMSELDEELKPEAQFKKLGAK